MSVNERRATIINMLCQRRHDTVANLAHEFNVSIRTIKYDIEMLTLSYPIYTIQGNGGGIYIQDGYYIGRKYLKPSQQDLLKKIAVTLQGDELETMQDILKTFALTNMKQEKNL